MNDTSTSSANRSLPFADIQCCKTKEKEPLRRGCLAFTGSPPSCTSTDAKTGSFTILHTHTCFHRTELRGLTAFPFCSSPPTSEEQKHLAAGRRLTEAPGAAAGTAQQLESIRQKRHEALLQRAMGDRARFLFINEQLAKAREARCPSQAAG